jgi:hypothetical protein
MDRLVMEVVLKFLGFPFLFWGLDGCLFLGSGILCGSFFLGSGILVGT